ncbi:MAG: hypothetical protein AAF267_22355 [Deinococcota bacterium]
MKERPTTPWAETVSTTVTVAVLVVLAILALGQATNRFEAVVTPLPKLEDLAILNLGPLEFEQQPPVTLPRTTELSLAELQGDFEAFETVYEIVESLERNLNAGPLAADILMHGEAVFNETYARSGTALGMNPSLSEHLLTLETALRAGDANVGELYDELVLEFEEALATSDTILHDFTGDDMASLIQTLQRDLSAGQPSEIIVSDLDELYSALLRQYNDSDGHAQGFADLSEHLQAVSTSLRDTGTVAEGQLEQLIEEMNAFFSES